MGNLLETTASETPSDRGRVADGAGLPLPIALGGIGLLISYSLPGGLTGGQGFAIGLAIGFALIVLAPAAHLFDIRSMRRSEHFAFKCPKCHTHLHATIGETIEAVVDHDQNDSPN